MNPFIIDVITQSYHELCHENVTIISAWILDLYQLLNIMVEIVYKPIYAVVEYQMILYKFFHKHIYAVDQHRIT